MVFSWFNTQKVDAFIDAEVADLRKRVPPAKLESAGAAAKKAQDQLAKSHDLLLRHAHDFVQREKPNLYQKARIANRMKWALREAKYPVKFVDEFAYALATVVASASSQREA
jgi:ribosomal protein L22